MAAKQLRLAFVETVWKRTISGWRGACGLQPHG